MYIDRIRLKGFKLFVLTDEPEVDITFDQPRHMVLGSNGSGKTSLLNECTARPANKQNFLTVGSKEIWFHDKGISYYGLSSFTKERTSYTLQVVDGDYLVEEGNMSTYNRVLDDLIGWTNKHTNLLSDVPISRLPPMGRKELFGLLNGGDVDRGLGLYFKLNSKLKEIKAQTKYIDNQIVAMEDRVLTEEELLNCKALYKETQSVIDELTKQRKPQPLTLRECRAEQVKTSESVSVNNAQQDRLKSKRDEILGGEKASTGDTTVMIEEMQSQLDTLKGMMSMVSDELSSLQTDKVTHDELSTVNKDELLSQIQEAKDRIARMGTVEKEQQSAQYLNERYTQLGHIRWSFWEQEFAYADMDKVSKELNEWGVKEKQGEALINNIKQTKKQIKGYEDNSIAVDCPACGHRWEHNPFKEELLNLEKLVKDYRNKYDVLSQEYADNKHQINEYNHLMDNYRQLKIALVPYDLSVTQLEDEMNKCFASLDKAKKYEDYSKVKAHLDELEKTFLLLTDKNKFNELRYSQLEKKYSEQTESYNHIFEQITGMRELEKLLTKLDALDQEHKTLSTTLEELFTMEEVIGMDMTIVNKIDQAQEKLLEHNTKITQAESNKDQMNAYIKDKSTLISKSELITSFMQNISPTDGLLAKSLMGNLNIVLKEANKLLEEIWEYPLSFVYYTSENSSSLKYQLPMLINGSHELKDIGQGSSSIRDISNFALTLAILRQLGMSDFPLYLDEFGRTMDAVHRSKAYLAIYSLYEKGYFSQLLMVSHQPDVYSNVSMGRTILCDKNIEL